MKNVLLLLLLIPAISFAQGAQTYIYDGELAIDVYNGGGSTDRPLLIFVHGGGFAGGSRDSQDVVAFCEKVADKNIVVASVSYELRMKGRGFGCDIPASEKVDTFRKAGEDVAMATNFLLKRSEDIGFDPDDVIIAGSSAGAETVLHLAFWDEVGAEILPAGFRYSGVISFAGAIKDPDLITEANIIPAMLVHGTCDQLVPYGSKPHHFCNPEDNGYLILHGSGSIDARYNELRAKSMLYSICGGNHDWASIPMKNMTEEVVSFIRDKDKDNHSTHQWISIEESCDDPKAYCMN